MKRNRQRRRRISTVSEVRIRGDEDSVQRVRGGGGQRAVLRRRSGALLGLRREGSRGEQAREQAPEGSSLHLVFSDAQVRHLPGLLLSFASCSCVWFGRKQR